MKQRITVEDLQQLTDDQKQKLLEWWKPTFGDVYLAHENTTHVSGGSYYSGEQTQIIDIADQLGRHHYKIRCIPLLSIGQMFELLDYFSYRISLNKFDYKWLLEQQHVNASDGHKHIGVGHEELCDALWSAVKYAL